MGFADTIAAIATAKGAAGVAIVRVSGPDAFAIAEKLTGKLPEAGRFRFCRMQSDEAVVLGFRGPNSYTGEDVVEFQCHGGMIAPRRVLEACFQAGARLARRGEFTERAFLNGRLDYDQAESVLDIISAKTNRAFESALAGINGCKQREYRRLYELGLEISSTLEHSLDVDEAELPTGFVQAITEKLMEFRRELDLAIRQSREGKILREGALVVLAGEPNAGKSSLMNALLRENRAIVSDTPGTTRDSIEEWLDLDGWPLRLVDTAGLRESTEAIEAEGIRRARELIDRADVIIDFGGSFPEKRSIRITAKCDLGRGEGINVSVRTGEGMDELKRAIIAKVENLEFSVETENLAPLISARELLPDNCIDLVLTANAVRQASEHLGKLIGATYSADLLDRLFSRFCVGK